MGNKMLTIAVPTYKRLHHLKRLLGSLCQEVQGLGESIEIFVSDNNSDDGTEDYLRDLSLRFKFLTFIAHEKNLGPDENFKACFNYSRAKFFWLLGDDDCPRNGFVTELMRLLNKSEEIDMIYLNSWWVKDIDAVTDDKAKSLICKSMNRDLFAESVNIWMGYISGIIIKKSLVDLKDINNLHALSGTNLIQLGWVLPVLKNGKKFLIIKTKCILATRNNTGGYAGITVFGENLPKILRIYLGDDNNLQKKILEPMILNFFTALVWKIQNQSDAGGFLSTHKWGNVCKAYDGFWMFRILTIPAYNLPKHLGIFFVIAAKILGMVRGKILSWAGYEFI